MFDNSPTDVRRAEHRFGDDTTTVFAPAHLSVEMAPPESQPTSQDTASFLVRDPRGAVVFEITASHFSSGNRAANMDKYRAIIASKQATATCAQVVMGDINTEVRSGSALQSLADQTQKVVLVPSLRIRRMRGLQDQLHKRMDHKDDHDSMFLAIEPELVDDAALCEVSGQNVAWPHRPEQLRWREAGEGDVAQAWSDGRILTDHAVLLCPLASGTTLSLGNVARANHDKYDIHKPARIDRHTYLQGQQVMETAVARAVLDFVRALPLSETLDAATKASVINGLERYHGGLGDAYGTAFDQWSDDDDLCTLDTPLAQAIKALGVHAQSFVKEVRKLSWEDVRDAPEARTRLRTDLTESLVHGLGLGVASGPLTGHEAFDAPTFQSACEAKIDAAWARILERQSAGDLYKMWFAELLQGQATGGMPIPAAVLAQPTPVYLSGRMRDLGLADTLCVVVESLR